MMISEKPNNPNAHYAIQEATPPMDTSHILRKHLNIPYSNRSSAQKLDVYLPEEGSGPFPVIVSIHGGAFMGCDKGDMQVIPMLEGLKHGFAVVAINYRMSGEAKFPALVQDAKAAVRWIRGNASQYGFDPKRIVAWGGSAGGYIATMLSLTPGVPALEDLTLGNLEQSCGLQAAVVWYAPTNFLIMDDQLASLGLLPPVGFRHNELNSPESLLLGSTITEIPALVKAANPETYIGDAIPPMLFQHGGKDPIVPVLQSIGLVDKLTKKFGENCVTLEIFENAEHADPAFETMENIKRVFRFFKECGIY